MEIQTTPSPIEEIDCDGIIIWNYEDKSSPLITKLREKLEIYFEPANFESKKEQSLTLFKIEGIKAPRVVLVGLGKSGEANHETVRVAVGDAVKVLESLKAKHIALDAVHNDAQSTAEGALLGLYDFDELKTKNDEKSKITMITFSGDDEEVKNWSTGVMTSQGQNYARRLAELPSNIGTPTYFVNEANAIFQGIDNVKVIAHEESWAKEKKMGAFLSVTAGTDEPAKFLEIHYNGGSEGERPVIFVGKGITFDTGGISIKPSAGMGLMRADCTGAATVIGTLYSIAKLALKMNVIGFAPLTENMPSGKATKPADVVYASNGKSIEIDNTDAEGRLVLSDALVYAETFNPHTVIDIATLTGSMMRALGNTFTGVFSRSNELWVELETAGLQSYERFWRMPLDDSYLKKLKSTLADIKNSGGAYGGASIGAMFLSEFISLERWAHIDIAGTLVEFKRAGYKPDGIPAIPVRALIQFVRNLNQ